ncbi:MAG: deoxyribose-phosphate aldolase [Erysipelotrichaceae bacterium]|jgi:deoxyribose-phosphate aldolase|nr:deoxyribose-phosphate aldolase [Bacillota bacterium]MDY0118276.1 deoxyribose-phosphate aldolase [Bacilli bacterium]NLJ32877.1 deoxyribose-phosphate aldolase [Erysipelotrichaceae bacterium]HOF65044.1 deoxyribose-phosphate aldolase [Bacilli bacterium]
MKYNKLIDHTLLKADATEEQIRKLCAEAKEHNFASVCVNPCFVPLASYLLADTDVLVCTVIGFPLGANATEAKVMETDIAIQDGAEEIDMVLNVSQLKAKNDLYVFNEILRIKQMCGELTLKVILETCLLTPEEIKRACEISVKAGADFVKTSTGFSTGGATVEAVKLMRETVGPHVGVKASGGVRTNEDLKKMVAAGANRIGTSSGPAII